MEAAAPPLKDLRAEIDRVDRQLLELLIERSEIVRQIGEIKDDRRNGRLAVRPGREAVILRGLVEGAAGRFPRAVLVRVWRELLGALTRLQTPMSVAVVAPRAGFLIWDLARDHFGSVTPMLRVDSATQALRSIGDASATVAVLPLPNDDDVWWPALMSDHEERLRAFARLPFVAGAASEGEQVGALALARIDPEPSGDDLALLAIEADAGLSRGRLRELLAAAGLKPVWHVGHRPPQLPHALHLIEVESFVAEGDARLVGVRDASRGEILRAVPVGGYPRPLPPE